MSKLTFKPFFHHFNPYPPGRIAYKRAGARGYTAYVFPTTKDGMVNLQIAMCTRNDPFCKKIGREQAQVSEVHCINARDIAKYLTEADAFVYGHTRYTLGTMRNDWILKKLL